MISHIEGRLDHIDTDPALSAVRRITIDVSGVGYEVFVAGSLLRILPKIGEKIKIVTYLNVKEDLMQLFGFASKEEKALFMHLISVSGIGPKGAMNILSSFEINRLVIAITKGDIDLLTSAQGIGKKTAQRVIIELKEKIGKALKDKGELIDARNMADSLIYSTQKSVKEVGDKLDESTKGDIDRAIENLKRAMEGDDTAEIKRLTEELTQASHKLAEAMYARASQQEAYAGGAAGAGSSGEPSRDEEVVDADFEEVKK